MMFFGKINIFLKLIIILVVLVVGIMLTQYMRGQNVSENTQNAQGKFCGGIAANLPEFQCPPGYYCKLTGDYPDAGGTCVKQASWKFWLQ
ncbi:MAG: hypothetical protein HYU04_01725 [Candidatus Wildermuthbacteria bacterium]|nr:hypothetical protein [Candidatus Wildermuthbacteria bacterium]